MHSAALHTWFDAFEVEQARIGAFLDEPDRRRRIQIALEEETAGERQSSPLSGVLFGVKDTITVDGLETRAGSRLPPALFSGPEATMVTRLRSEGAVVAGKTTTTEFAFSEPSETHNPRALSHTPGGSSSGSAAAVAAGMVRFALGTQTVDSIVTPAAYCGIVGLKPSYGRVPLDGVVPFSPSMDHGGLLASNVATAQMAARVLCDRWDGSTRLTGRVIGVPGDRYLERADADGLQNLNNVLAKLESEGFEIAKTDVLDDIDEIGEIHRDLIAAEFARVAEPWFAEYGHLIRPRTHEIYSLGQSLGGEAIRRGLEHSDQLRDRLLERMDRLGLSAWIAPAATGFPPDGLDYIGDPVMGRPWTHAHLPVVALPTTNKPALPLGVQLIGRPNEDENLLALALLIEGAVS